ncbi:carboxypeptidase-like regulatory domain-containing protein [Flavobacterium sp. H122]|uniref:carboxypeptidase-like regulatory domain-containing protein n=1 Tax=Flavobacterium sp. H122 TaxID=2529860 RepID=UPI0010AA902E|nr:carboxypeptidase regulatory-like domain-containing protein [Flavobacterium sp. H122]
MKKLVFSTLMVLQAILVFAQQPTGISGKVIDSKTNAPLQNVVTSIENTNLTQLTDSEGKFRIVGIGVGNQILKVKSDGYKEQLLPLEIIANQVLDLGVVVLEEDIQTQEQQLSLVTLTENDLGDDNSGSESTSGLLQASRDVFQQAAAFNWGQARFRVRGLDTEYGVTMINGISMNKIYDGRPQWGNWGGLNDATRNQEFTMGSAPSDYTFGSLLGTQEINTRASIYRPGTRISFSGTNTNYNWRMMGTHASGLDKNGWAFIVSAGRRWAQEAHFEGTDYSANSFFASVEKRFGSNHALNFTSIYAQNRRGKNSPNTQEVIDLKGYDYNSYWGWQNGEKRNSRIKNLEEPILMLGHFWKLNDKTTLNTHLMYQTGQIGNSRLEYQNAGNPDPTYYQNLPSFELSKWDPVTLALTPNQAAADLLEASFLSGGQIKWEGEDGLYAANTNKIEKNSNYVLYEDRTDDKLIAANSVINSVLSDNISFNGGVSIKKLKSENFQNLLDLLGGEYFNDIDPFANSFDQSQSDLNNPNRQVGLNERFGYNYNLYAKNLNAFTQFKFNYKKVDFYLGQSYTFNEYQREGLYKNGYYPTNSFGKSDKVRFENFGFKGGATFKLGNHLLDFNALYQTKAPALKNVFGNARVNNQITANAQSETITGFDGSYIIRTPDFKGKITAYYSTIKNATETGFFFAEGSVEGTNGDDDAFVNEVVTGVDKENMGLEVGLEYNITKTIKATAAAAIGQYIYANNPNVTLNVDSSQTSFNYGDSYMKNYKIPGAPQQAFSVGIEYRDPNFWWIGANANYLDNNYLDVAPLLRVKNFVYEPGSAGSVFPEANEDRLKELLKQEKFDPVRLVNLSGGKSWRINNITVGLFASINNLFDSRYKTGGFEQARNANYREYNQDRLNGTPSFGPKYFISFGRTYFANFYINF